MMHRATFVILVIGWCLVVGVAPQDFQKGEELMTFQKGGELSNDTDAVLHLGTSSDDSIWRPISKDPKHVAGIALAAFFIMVAAGSGLGGGGILVPLYMLMLDLDDIYAVALSNITILGSSLMNVLINTYRRHPVGDRPMIAWEVVLVMEPASILGTVAGSFLNEVSPQWMTTVLMIVFLGWTTVRTFKKARRLYSIESQSMTSFTSIAPAKQMKYERSDSNVSDISPLISKEDYIGEETRRRRALSLLDMSIDEDNLNSPVYDNAATEDLKSSRRESNAKNRPELLAIYKRERASCPLTKFLPMVALQVTVILLFFAKEMSRCGSWVFWTISASFLPLTFVFMFFVRRYLLRINEERILYNYEFLDGDIKWDTKTTVWFPFICINAGIIASWFGLGGGTVKGPLMMEMGILPEVTAATSSTMMLFTTISAVTGYIAMDRVLVYYGCLMLSLGLVCTLVAQLLLKHYIDKLKRPSLVVYLFATVCLLGVLSMLVVSSGDIIDMFKGNLSGFRPVCP